MAVHGKLKRLADLCRGALIALSLFAGAWALPAGACPICGVPTVTLTERLARADVALLVEWVSSQPATNDTAEKTTFEIVQVHRDALGKYKTGERVSVGQITAGKAGNLFLLMGQKDDKLGVRWEREPALAVSETSYQYIIQAPSPETPAEKRLTYFIKFLEFPDVAIANDAFGQFVNAPTKDIYAVAEKLPREKLRRWLADAKTPPTRRSGYGLMLGLCGDSGDAQFLKQLIDEATEDNNLGMEGVTFGYLLLAGEKGLTEIEKSRLSNKDLTDGEVHAAALAIRYFWSYGNSTISQARMQAAMRLMLNRPSQRDSAIKDLARWKDWSLNERLMKMYRKTKEDSLKKAVIHYMIAETKDVAKGEKEPPAHVVAARRHLDELRDLDPKLVADGEKFFFFN